MPVVSTRDSGAVGVLILVTTDAVQPGHAFAFRTAHDVRKMPVPIVALLRIVGGSVTVDAAWRDEYGVDLIPRCESGGCVYAIRFCGERNDYRKQCQREKRSYRREHSIPLLVRVGFDIRELLGVSVNYHAARRRVTRIFVLVIS